MELMKRMRLENMLRLSWTWVEIHQSPSRSTGMLATIPYVRTEITVESETNHSD